MIDKVIDDRFHIKERLVRQGAVELFEGHDLDEGQPIWIKLLSSPLIQDLDFIKNWRGQLLSLQGMDDQHVPQILAFGRMPEGQLYQIEDPPFGLSLRRYTDQHAPLTLTDSVRIIEIVARAVNHAHREGIAHGGLSPEAIYIDGDHRGEIEVFITHWEMGELVIALHHAHEPLSDRLKRYLSPEQRSETVPPPTPAGDVYALGTILYELLTGSLPTSRPFATGQDRVSDKVSRPTPPSRFNPDISDPIERELLRALDHDPATRHANGRVFADALRQALASTSESPTVKLADAYSSSNPYAQPTQEASGCRRALPIVGLLAFCVACIALVGVAGLTWWWQGETLFSGISPYATDNAVELTATAQLQIVPDLKGPPYVSYNEAVQLAWNKGFQVKIVNFREDLDVPPGVIVDQCPAGGLPRNTDISACPRAGSAIPPEGTILIEVSSLPEPEVLLVVPDLYAQPEEEIRKILEEGGLRIGTRYESYDLLIPPGHIVEQNPRRGLAVLPGTFVDIVVSAGLPSAHEDGLSVQPSFPTTEPFTDTSAITPAVEDASGIEPSYPAPETEALSSNGNQPANEPDLTASPLTEPNQPVSEPNLTPSPLTEPSQPNATLPPAIPPTIPPTAPPAVPPTASATAPPTESLPTSTAVASPSATVVSGPSETPVQEPAPEPAESQAQILSDDFEEGNVFGWYEDEYGVIEDGVFYVEIDEPNQLWGSQANQFLDNYVYQATVTLEDGGSFEPDAGAGLIFRIQDPDHFYFFEINNIGDFRLRARDGTEWRDLIGWAMVPFIELDGLPNVLEVRANKEALTLLINGQVVAGQYDVPSEQTYLIGDIGLGAQTNGSSLFVEFDDVLVTLPIE